MRGFSLESPRDGVCVGDGTTRVFLIPLSYVLENGWDGKLHGTRILLPRHMLAFCRHGKIITKGT